ncbi:hypothetical protein [Aureibacter tunicatorum]|uniref:Uncharacterized protein n=1 Tax=Aureibacter tunicatorum TaxID=866807 RepID=A0AAE4BSJ0_9BACT|nr:hypothetical protein [Aureibacter tunicatorum]MDR6238873.1 hypothetical protein [Aureibacter tunicatorum]BDD05200.1 hypothetical protein AUTU_26830 [Aureibacter tunicatorum]
MREFFTKSAGISSERKFAGCESISMHPPSPMLGSPIQCAKVSVHQKDWTTQKKFKKDPFGRYLMLPNTSYPHLTIYIHSKSLSDRSRTLEVREMHYSPSKEGRRHPFVEHDGVFKAEYSQADSEQVRKVCNELLANAGFGIEIQQGSWSRADNDRFWRKEESVEIPEEPDVHESQVELPKASEECEDVHEVLDRTVALVGQVDQALAKPEKSFFERFISFLNFQSLITEIDLKLKKRPKTEKKQSMYVKYVAGDAKIGPLVDYIIDELEMETDVPELGDYLDWIGDINDLSEEQMCTSINSEAAWMVSTKLLEIRMYELEEDLTWLKNVMDGLYFAMKAQSELMGYRATTFFFPNKTFEMEYSVICDEHDHLVKSMLKNMEKAGLTEDVKGAHAKEVSQDFFEHQIEDMMRLRREMVALIKKKCSDPLPEQERQDRVMFSYPYRSMSQSQVVKAFKDMKLELPSSLKAFDDDSKARKSKKK